MNIRRSAWHFRIYRFLISMWSEGPDVLKGRRTLHKPRDLCHYFWTLALLALTFPIWIVFAVILTIVFAVVMGFWLAWDYIIHPPLQKLNGKLDARIAENAAKRPPRVKKEKQPGLVRTYLKARKQKICPVITIVDE